MATQVCIAGATGWVGRALVSAIVKERTFRLVGAVSRTHQGKPLGEPCGIPGLDLIVCGSVDEALQTKTDVLIDYTGPDAVKRHVLTAIGKRVHVVIGTSGLTDEDFAEIDGLAREYGGGVLAAGNFAISAVLLQKFAEIASSFIPHWEISDMRLPPRSTRIVARSHLEGVNRQDVEHYIKHHLAIAGVKKNPFDPGLPLLPSTRTPGASSERQITWPEAP